MPPLEPRKSAESLRDTASRPQSISSSTESNQPRLSQVLTGQHLDDQSHYQKEHGEAAREERKGESQPYLFVDLEKRDGRVSPSTSTEEHAESREAYVNEQDVEAPLEKVRSTKSVKDPDLVRIALGLHQFTTKYVAR